jgi:Phage Mu protein F like protein
MPPPTLPDAAAQQQAAVEVFAQHEPALYEAYLDMMLEWLAGVRAAMFAGGVAQLALMPDPMTIFSQGPKWAALAAKYTAQVAREVLAAPYRDLFADGQLFNTRPFVRNWIADTDNRLQAVPDQVFGLVSQIIDSATTNGASIPDVQDQIEQLFSATGTPTWKNRARTVARTEVVGAYNGGLHDAFAMIVETDPGTKYVHRWLATEDARTRPDHVEADGQVQPWGEPFRLGPGGLVLMMHPHALGAPANQVVNCRCVELLEIENEPTPMGNRQYKGPPSLRASGLTLHQEVCHDATFCKLTGKPGLCKGQKRDGYTPGYEEEIKKTPAKVAQTAVDGLSQAIRIAQTVAANNPQNPKLAAMARKAVAGYKRALVPHQQKLKDAARADAQAKREGERDTRQQDMLDRRAARQKETLKKRADRIRARRAEQAKLAKMTPKQRTAYRKAKADAAARQRRKEEDRTLKEAAK